MPGLSALLVDDDDFVRATVAQQLRGVGVDRVVDVADGHLALRAVQHQGPFDLIVSDLLLPGLDGIELLRDLAVHQPQCAVVLISALDETVLRSAAVLARQRGLRALGALRKPIRQEALQRLVVSLSRTPEAAADEPPCAAGDALQLAIERGQIQLAALPRLSVREGALGGAELRLHWTIGGAAGFQHASVFATAGRCGLSARLTDYFLARAVRIATDWWSDGLRIPIGLSLPAAALQRLDLPDVVDRHLRDGKLLPQMLQLGFPDAAVLGDEQALDILTRLRMRAVGVCIDDFGSAQRGFLQIQRVPATQVRIGAHLMQLGGTGERLVEHMLHMAATLGREVVADGVQTASQYEFLARHGCALVQGPHVGTAVTAEVLAEQAEQYRSVNASAAAAAEVGA
jgi:EAL domain-containing protein (putative c-di-GMP-specific phosphodiesterase class I)/FixJ family two-component response regulator